VPRREVPADLRREPETAPTVFPLAVLVGLFGLFAADARAGGLTGGQGFLLGLLATLVVLATATGSGRRRAAGASGSFRHSIAVVCRTVFESCLGNAFRIAAVSIGIIAAAVIGGAVITAFNPDSLAVLLRALH